jgi:outer membrane protein OmpA-like peptidoglycan-associated protein
VEGDERPSWEIDVNPGQVRGQGPKEDIGSGSFEETLNRPIKVALWVQNGRARLYANGERVADVNQMFVPKDMQPPRHWVVWERCDRADDGWVGIRTVRMAESAPDFSAVMASSGKYVTHGIRFDTDSDRIQPESAAVIKSVARGLEKNPNLKLRITGYTDSTGSADHNTDLSKRRAEAVRTVLISDFGVDASRLSADGKGAANPIGSNDTPDGRAQNRRVEFVKE